MKVIAFKHIFLLFFAMMIYNFVNAQADSSSSILSKLYFPFDFGYTISKGHTIKPGGLIKTGLEYRSNKDRGLFIRFNIDNRSSRFAISENQTTNVIDGKLKFDDHTLGLGYRIGSEKLKGIILFQSGVSVYKFPTISRTLNNFEIKDAQSSTPTSKLTFGVEYYVAKNAALTLETAYILQNSNSVFWKNSLNTLGVSFGLTTTLF
jgi:hypothetical protein